MNDIDELLAQGGLSLERLATLCRVASAGGLSKAAAGDVSKLSLYSRQIKDLEAFFGVALTRRVGRSVVMTEAARSLAARVRGQFKDLLAFREEAVAAVPSLTIGASHSLLEWWLWPRMGSIVKSLPDGVRIRAVAMRSAHLVRAVEDRELDVVLVRSDALPRALRSKPMFVVKYRLFVPQAMVPKATTGKALLTSLPLAIASGGQFRSQLDAATARAGISLNIQLECPSFTLAARAVSSGAYAAVLPDQAEIGFKGLPVANLDLPLRGLPPRSIALVWHPRASEAKSRVVLSALRIP